MTRTNVIFVRLVCCVLIATSAAMSPLDSFMVRAAYPTSPVVIGEVAWAGSTLSTADEWIELWNVSDNPLSLAGWSLRGAGESSKTIYLPASAIIPAHGTYLVSNYDMTDAKSVLALTPQVVTTTVSLSNSQLGITLYDAQGNLVDSSGTGGAPLAGASLPQKITLLRSDPTQDGTLAAAWTNSTTTQNMKPGTTDLGTPGICDFCYIQTQSAPAPPNDTQTSTTTESGDDSTDTTSTDSTATSTQQIATSTDSSDESASSTADIPGDASVASTTDQIVATTTESTNQPTTSSTSNTDVVQTSATTQTSATNLTATTTQPVSKPVYAMLRLNEVAPYPASGKEWVEITTLDAGNDISLYKCELHDSKSRILILGRHTIHPGTNRYIKIEIPSSKLNNDGDSVSLYDPSGQLLDTLSYTATKKGQDWIRYPDSTGAWTLTTSSTPAAINILTPPPSKTVAVSNTTQASDTVQIASAASTQEQTADGQSDDQSIELDDVPSATVQDQSSKTVKTSSAKTAASKKATLKKTTASKSKADPIIPMTFDMLYQQDTPSIRVRLEGQVGSVPGLLTGHAFILQSAEGRGISVSMPTVMRLPDFGSTVAVVGRLLIDDRNTASLKMASKDTCTRLATSTSGIMPRIVDLTAPSNEDGWSLINVTGTVVTIKGRTVHLDLGDAEIDMLIRPTVRYRPERLAVGDTVAAAGLLDATRDDARILPRSADDIVLLRHAELKAGSTSASSSGPVVPGWTPLGAAAGAVAATEGAKQLHRRRKQKKLEEKLTSLTKIQA